MDPPAQWPFTYLTGVPKKDPREKRAIGVLTTPLRLLGRILSPIYQSYDKQYTDPGDTAAKGASLINATYERHAVAEALHLTQGYNAAILWDLETFFDSIKTYIALARLQAK